MHCGHGDQGLFRQASVLHPTCVVHVLYMCCAVVHNPTGVVHLLCRESPSGGDSAPRRKKFELEGAVKQEAHKLKRIVDAQAALAALRATGG